MTELTDYLDNEDMSYREKNKEDAISILTQRGMKEGKEIVNDIYMKIVRKMSTRIYFDHLWYHNTFLFEQIEPNYNYKKYHLICVHFEDGSLKDIRDLTKCMKFIKRQFRGYGKHIHVYLNLLNMNWEKLIIEISFWSDKYD